MRETQMTNYEWLCQNEPEYVMDLISDNGSCAICDHKDECLVADGLFSTNGCRRGVWGWLHQSTANEPNGESAAPETPVEPLSDAAKGQIHDFDVRVNGRLVYEASADDCRWYVPDMVKGIEWGGAEAALRRERQKRGELEKLVRELRSVMWACAEQRCTHREAGCFRVAGNGTRPQGDGACWFEKRLRELGIEEAE